MDIEYCRLNVNRKINDGEARLLMEYAALVPENGLILDIGTCEGGSAFALAIGSRPSVKVVTIDPTPNPRVYMHRKNLKLEDRIEIIEKESQKVSWNRPLNLFFNDGLHKYEGIVEDNAIYCPHVVKGGLCMFHDFSLYSNTVGKAILEGEDKYYKRRIIINNIYIGEKL